MSNIPTNANFKIGDNVVYPSHGVGKITSEETQVIAGTQMKLYVITFAQDKMVLRVPKSRAVKTGLRHLSSEDEFKKVIDVLKSKARIAKGMWSKRAQKYETKINSGSMILIAEVLRDLHKNVEDPDRSYSERTIYDLALNRLTNEYAVVMQVTRDVAQKEIIQILDDNLI